jgi:positive regulator of sigma E activity
MYPLIIVLVAIIVATIAYNGHIEQNDIAISLLALLGTFLGATFAFRLNEHKEQQKIAEPKKVALNRALFVLSRQYNAVKCIYKLMENYKSD